MRASVRIASEDTLGAGTANIDTPVTTPAVPQLFRGASSAAPPGAIKEMTKTL